LNRLGSYVLRNCQDSYCDKTNTVILYKIVSKDWLTQAGTCYQTSWRPGTILTEPYPCWKPDAKECGEGKFHACARAEWCDYYYLQPGLREARYIAIRVRVEDLFEWLDEPKLPGKIAFKAGEVLYEVDKYGRRLGADPAQNDSSESINGTAKRD